MNLDYIVVSMIAYFIAFIYGNIMVKRAVVPEGWFTDTPFVLFGISSTVGWYCLIQSLGV